MMHNVYVSNPLWMGEYLQQSIQCVILLSLVVNNGVHVRVLTCSVF